jgi:hypothetical protein
VIDEQEVFEKSFWRYEPGGGSFEHRRVATWRRNQRIAAGRRIAVFVAAIMDRDSRDV